jgi:hypothetical protein
VTDASGDPIVDRAIDALRRLPPLDDLAVRRIVTAAAARRDVGDAGVPEIGRRRGARRVRLWLAVGLASAAAVAGFIVPGAWSTSQRAYETPATTATIAAAAAATPPSIQNMHMAAGRAADAAPVPVQFVMRSAAAHRVSVVGDFNKWNPGSARMTRSPAGDLWSITIAVAPGRHMYGFMIDDTVFALDPRAPKARDPDLGAEGSVVIAGRP